MTVLIQSLGHYIQLWTTTPTVLWHEDRPFDCQEFSLYLQSYRWSARTHLVPPAIPEHMQAPSKSEIYSIASVAGTRYHAGDLTLEAQEKVAAFMRRVETGPPLPHP